MMGRIIRLHDDHHWETQSLLPWYVTGRLDARDKAKVETHLGGCAECQAELAWERRTRTEVASLPADVDQGWAELRRQMTLGASKRAHRRAGPAWFAAGLRWFAVRPWMGWVLAGQAISLIVVVAVAPTAHRPAAYHALGAAPVVTPGNLVVIFRPDTSERQIRELLKAASARLVDGPTSADAYVLTTPANHRAAALATLRGQAAILLAEPIDSEGPS